MDTLSIPHPDRLRDEIRRKVSELTAMRKLLRMADAALKSGMPLGSADKNNKEQGGDGKGAAG